MVHVSRITYHRDEKEESTAKSTFELHHNMYVIIVLS
jgi:hypothetical protein